MISNIKYTYFHMHLENMKVFIPTSSFRKYNHIFI